VRVEQQAAYVLHARAYRETSLLLELFTQDHGRVGAIARGVRGATQRNARAILQPLQPLLCSWSARGELATLGNIEAAASPLILHGELLLCAMYVNELVLRLTARQDAHPEAFTDYVQCLQRLAAGEPAGWTLRRFERDLLEHLGYALVLDHEPDTGLRLLADMNYSYHAEYGPRPWTTASSGICLRGEYLLALATDRMPEAVALSALKRMLRSVISFHLGGSNLRAWSLLQALPAIPSSE
jgi:DNA repair protein RecO (recombination protein O)